MIGTVCIGLSHLGTLLISTDGAMVTTPEDLSLASGGIALARNVNI